VGEVVAMPIRSSLNQGVFFEPEMIALMSEAFEAACKMLHDADQQEAMREVIARRIIAAARFGERDPARWSRAAERRARPRVPRLPTQSVQIIVAAGVQNFALCLAKGCAKCRIWKRTTRRR
jgi:hypothetical protein